MKICRKLRYCALYCAVYHSISVHTVAYCFVLQVVYCYMNLCKLEGWTELNATQTIDALHLEVRAHYSDQLQASFSHKHPSGQHGCGAKWRYVHTQLRST